MLYRMALLLSLAILIASFASLKTPQPYTFPDLKHLPKMPMSIDNPITVEGVDLGRHLFYDSILSLNYNLSCGSCHHQEMAFADAPHQFSKGNMGIPTKRNTMPLFNLAWYKGFFWDGKAATIEAQALHPVRDSLEMNLDWNLATARLKKRKFYRKKFELAFGNASIDSLLVAKALGQFLRTLISNDSKFDQVLNRKAKLTEDEYEGYVLINDMTKGDCLHCHTTDGDLLGTTGNFSNNGLDAIANAEDYMDKGLGAHTNNKNDNGKFKIPSLRNVGLTAPYMHDGRFKTLEAVIDFYSEGVHQAANVDSKMGFAHQRGARLSPLEKKQIIAFLHTLSDSTFIHNKAFSNPFSSK
jgi:cytochrome c peroxidase